MPHDKNGLCILKLNRPAVANAYNEEMLMALSKRLEDAGRDESVRAVIFTGQGKRHFCAGADLGEIGAKTILDALNLRSADLFNQIALFPKPTIAAINGDAVGGGLELALACDLRTASATARMWLPEISLGIIPAAGGARRLPGIIGKGRAKEMIFTGRKIDAQTALAWGLINDIAQDALVRAMEIAEKLAKMDPEALILAKTVMGAGVEDQFGDRLSRLAQARLYHKKYEG
jgi:enoyl-CoA hydratase/carnithine racemase